MTRSLSAAWFLAVAGILAAVAYLAAGPLDPPPGPVSGSYKTLSEVEPRIAINAANTPGDADSIFKIAQPGSYYLTGNITGVSGKHGIKIVADNVTLDLMGLTLTGVPGSFDGVNAAIVVAGVHFGLSVRNGALTGWGDDGVDLTLATGGACEGLIATGNTGTGIISSIGGAIIRCTARANGVGGFSGAIVMRDCYASNNTGDGVVASGTVENCSSGVNTGHGFTAPGRAEFSNCHAGGNTLAGFNIADTGVAKGCDATQNTGSGFVLANGAMAVNCSSTDNGGDGFTLSNACTVRASNAWLNSLDGIRAAGGCMIAGNHCASNDSAGIQVTGSDNRVEGNNVIGNERGLYFTAAGNLIVGNSASGNSLFHFDLVAGNSYGQIVNTPGGQAIQGSASPGNGVNSTNPWANFTY